MRVFMKAAGSWWVTASFALGAAVLYIAYSFGLPVEASPYEKWSNALLHTPWGIGFCLAVIAQLAILTVRVAWERVRGAAATPSAVRAMDSVAEFVPESREALGEWLVRLGFEPVELGGGGEIIARSGAHSYLPGAVLRLGFIVFLGASIASAHLREQAEVLAHPGEAASILGHEFGVLEVSIGLPREFMRVGESETFSIERASASLEAAGGRRFEVSNGYPTMVAGLAVRVTHAGLRQPLLISRGPEAEKYLPGRAEWAEIVADLEILPPGRAHELDLAGGGALSVALEPERVIRKGLLTGSLYDLESPRYRITLAGHEGVGGGEGEDVVIGPGESGAVGDIKISLGERSHYVKLLAVRDPALLALYAGSVILVLGLVLMIARFFWYERTLCVAFEGDRAIVGYSEEFYKKWGALKFRRWMNDAPGR